MDAVRESDLCGVFRALFPHVDLLLGFGEYPRERNAGHEAVVALHERAVLEHRAAQGVVAHEAADPEPAHAARYARERERTRVAAARLVGGALRRRELGVDFVEIAVVLAR